MNCSGFVGWSVDIISCGLDGRPGWSWMRWGCVDRWSLWSLGLVLCPSFCAWVFPGFGRCARALDGRRRPSPSALRFAPVRGSLRAPGTSAFGHVSRGNTLRMRLNCNYIRLRRRQL